MKGISFTFAEQYCSKPDKTDYIEEASHSPHCMCIYSDGVDVDDLCPCVMIRDWYQSLTTPCR